MSVQLPKPIAAYFAGNTRFDVDAMLAPFAEDALVGDERRTHKGYEPIKAWIEEASVGNQAVATPLSVTSDGVDQVVVAQVAGKFPCSPIELTFRFTLANDRIARLDIG